MARRLNKLFLETARKLHQVNPDMVEGFPTKEVLKFKPYLLNSINDLLTDYKIDMTLKSIEPIPLKLVLTPNTSAYHDISWSDMVFHNLNFSFKGRNIRLSLQLPCPRGNILTISGVDYMLIPSLTGKVVEKRGKNLNINLIKKTIVLTPLPHNVILNGEPTIENIFTPNIVRIKAKMNIPATLYKLSRDGLRDTVGCDFHFVKKDGINALVRKLGTKMADWDILQSEVNSDISILVPTDANHADMQHFYDIIYVFTNLPAYAKDVIDVMDEDDIENELYFWKCGVALLSENNKYPVTYNINQITDMISNLESFNERQAFKILEGNGVTVDNFIDLLDYCSVNFIKASNMKSEGSRLDINGGLAAPIIGRINEFLKSKKDVLNGLSPSGLSTMMSKNLQSGIIFAIKKSETVVEILEQTNCFRGFQASHTNTVSKRSYQDNLDLIIPKAEDTITGNLNTIPISLPGITSVNPNLEYDEFIEYPKELDVLREDLRR